MLSELVFTDKVIDWNDPLSSKQFEVIDNQIIGSIQREGNKLFLIFTMKEELEEKCGVGHQEVKIKIRPTDAIMVEVDGKYLRARQLKLPVFTIEKVMWIYGWNPVDKFHHKKYVRLKEYAEEQAAKKGVSVIETNLNDWTTSIKLSDGERYGYQILKGQENPPFNKVREFLYKELETADNDDMQYRIKFVLKYFDRIEVAAQMNQNIRNKRKAAKLKAKEEERNNGHK